jgi:hypothetical protein
MKISFKPKQAEALLGVLVLLAIVSIAPHAFAQMYTDLDDPHGPLEGMAWAVGMAAAGVVSGIGIWAAVRRTH